MASATRTSVKGPNAFRTISEAAEAVGAPQHVLRFWETRFSFVTPLKRAGGRRFYRPQDIVVLKAIRRLLHDEGLTIKGVLRLYGEQGLERLAAYGETDAPVDRDARRSSKAAEHGLTAAAGAEILNRLMAAKARLDAVLSA